MQTVLDIHNRERAEVRVPPLTWSDSLAAQAQGYADQLRSQGYVCNSNNNDNRNVCKSIPPFNFLPHGASGSGENLAWGSAGYTIAQLAGSWVSEKSNYNAQTNTCAPNKVCGHYTQMVWQGTTQVGCGTASGAEIVILVCRYNPPGNMAGQAPFGQSAEAPTADQGTGAPPSGPGNVFEFADQGTGAPPSGPGNVFEFAEEDDGGDGGDNGGDNGGDGGDGDEN